MAISGIVLSVHDPASALDLARRLSGQPWITLGERDGARLAAVVEADDGEDEALLDQLRNDPAVIDVAIASIHFPTTET